LAGEGGKGERGGQIVYSQRKRGANLLLTKGTIRTFGKTGGGKKHKPPDMPMKKKNQLWTKDGGSNGKIKKASGKKGRENSGERIPRATSL